MSIFFPIPACQALAARQRRQLYYHNIVHTYCQELFSIFFANFFGRFLSPEGLSPQGFAQIAYISYIISQHKYYYKFSYCV